MSQVLEVYKCLKCGVIVEVMSAGGGTLSCCDAPMKLMKEGSTDGALEKHVPVIEKTAGGYKVSVGSVLHPMEEKHYIMWIELIAGDITQRKFLKPGEQPVAEFKTDATKVVAREYCNLHGLWKAEA